MILKTSLGDMPVMAEVACVRVAAAASVEDLTVAIVVVPRAEARAAEASFGKVLEREACRWANQCSRAHVLLLTRDACAWGGHEHG